MQRRDQRVGLARQEGEGVAFFGRAPDTRKGGNGGVGYAEPMFLSPTADFGFGKFGERDKAALPWACNHGSPERAIQVPHIGDALCYSGAGALARHLIWHAPLHRLHDFGRAIDARNDRLISGPDVDFDFGKLLVRLVPRDIFAPRWNGLRIGAVMVAHAARLARLVGAFQHNAGRNMCAPPHG